MKKKDFLRIAVDHRIWLNTEERGDKAEIVNDNIEDFDIRYIDLSKSDLTGTKFKNVTFDNVKFSDAVLKRTKFINCTFFDTDFTGCMLNGASFINDSLIDVLFNFANLSYALFKDTNIVRTVFNRADLYKAKMVETDIDYSNYPLWCGSLDLKIDDKIAIQLLYHLLKNVVCSEDVSDPVKNILLDYKNISLANNFHRINECGKIIKK